ncbi:hypothetical protein BKA70DRAFT_1064831, partial [Coprinopsis sp. MPI-PUGE-AT-0042]
HPQYKTHQLRLRPIETSPLPHPIGPQLPRRDKESIYSYYCAIMLLLFSPWRSEDELQQRLGENAVGSFNHWLENTNSETRQRLSNMQLLHECKDSKDDHHAQRR